MVQLKKCCAKIVAMKTESRSEVTQQLMGSTTTVSDIKKKIAQNRDSGNNNLLQIVFLYEEIVFILQFVNN